MSFLLFADSDPVALPTLRRRWPAIPRVASRSTLAAVRLSCARDKPHRAAPLRLVRPARRKCPRVRLLRGDETFGHHLG